MTIEIIEEVMPGTSIIEEIVNLELSVIEGDTAAAEAAAAAAAASAASASGSASTSTTQAGIATTKAQEAGASATAAETAKTGAETAETNAETAQAGAEAARDEITDKVVFTGLQVGDLLQAVDVSGVVKLVRVEPVELLKDKNVFFGSPIFPKVGSIHNITFWDNFSQADGDLITSDSGGTYVNLVGNGFEVISNRAIAKTGGNILGIPCPNISSIVNINQSLSTVARFYFWVDANNHVEFEVEDFRLKINRVVGGVKTEVVNKIWTLAGSLVGNGISYTLAAINSSPIGAALQFSIKIDDFISSNFVSYHTATAGADFSVFNGTINYFGVQSSATIRRAINSILISNPYQGI